MEESFNIDCSMQTRRFRYEKELSGFIMERIATDGRHCILRRVSSGERAVRRWRTTGGNKKRGVKRRVGIRCLRYAADACRRFYQSRFLELQENFSNNNRIDACTLRDKVGSNTVIFFKIEDAQQRVHRRGKSNAYFHIGGYYSRKRGGR